MEEISIVTTAVRRPEVLRETYQSFKDFFDGYDCTLIINVDPVGDPVSSESVVGVAAEFFPHVNFRCPKRANFADAFKWCWEQVTKDLCVFLEDDWRLIRKIYLKDMVAFLRDNPELAILRLAKFPATEQHMKNWNLFFPWNGRYYECPVDLRKRVGFCGHPSLIRGEWVKATLPFIHNRSNPEKQFQFPERNLPLLEEILKWKYGVWAKPGDSPAIQDIGRAWISKTNWKKEGSKSFFMRWKEINPTDERKEV